MWNAQKLVVLTVLAMITVVVDGADDSPRPYGINKRVPWTTSRITGSLEPPPPYRIERVFPKLTLTNPVILTNAPGTDRLFVAEVNGKVVSFPSEGHGDAVDLFCNLPDSIDGVGRLYGLTFHPRFAENRYCYICYTLGDNKDDGTIVSRFTVSTDDPPVLDATSEKRIITWRSGGHNGGCLKFGPDGYLYISSGDGGPAFPPDPRGSGQDVSNLLSSVLRIDVDHPQGEAAYSIPSDNPFVDLEGARGEVWCYGLRNPWKISFDSVTGDLWVGDVGWELWEMIYRVRPGDNYGWSLVEGPQPVHRERERGPTPIVPPTVQHSHIESRSITGGLVYRGQRLPDLHGAYVYGDYVTGKLWGAWHDADKVTEVKELVDTTLQIICFGVDNDEELYVVAYDGTIHRLVTNEGVSANKDFPKKLSDTGLFSSVADHEVAAGVIPYSINAEPWMDGATADRFVALPNDSSLGINDSTNVQVGYIKGHWRFPTDGVLVKTISLDLETGNPASRRRLETQILHFDVDTWRAYSYIWNDEQTDAVLNDDKAVDRSFTIDDPSAPGGQRQQTWHFASRTECILCHTTRGGSIYGFQPEQLDRLHDYGDVSDNQLRTLKHIGVYDELATTPSDKIADPYDEQANLEQRARAYLHVNCAHCHRRGGGGTAAMDVQLHFTLKKTNLLDARPTQGTFNIHGAEVLSPSDPSRSVMLYRMAKLGRGRMPYIGSSEVDVRGVRLMREWISSLPSDSSSETAADIASLDERPADQRRAAINKLTATTNGAMALLDAIDRDVLSPATREVAINVATSSPDIQVRDLFERFLPSSQRTQRLGTSIDPRDILGLEGDVGRGRQLFLTTAGVQCRNCHRAGKDGRKLGPDLDQVAKKNSREQLLESILQPSKKIDPQYATHLVETAAGQVFTGLLVEKSEKEVVLTDAQAKVVRIPTDEIEFSAPQQKSLMPELLLQDMTAQQVADLLAWMSSLK